MRSWWRVVVALGAVPLAAVDWADDPANGVFMLVVGTVPFGAMALARRPRSSMLVVAAGLYALWFWFYRDAMAHRDPLPPAVPAGAIWLTVAAVAVAGVIVADTIRAADRRQPWWWALALTAITLFCALFDLLALVVLADDHGSRMSTPTADDLRPLPATLRIVSISECDGGSAGNCTRQFRIAATDGAPRSVIVDRLIANLDANGWSIDVSDRFGNGCRSVPGRVLYTDHCLVIGIDRNLDWVPGVPPDQVVIQIDNAD